MAADGNDGDSVAERYVVLARKYRPETFTDLIGQEAMVTTLKNAFATDRIAQGYMLTGCSRRRQDNNGPHSGQSAQLFKTWISRQTDSRTRWLRRALC